MAIDTSKIKTGPWEVKFKGNYIGAVTTDGITLSFDARTRERMVDRYGENLVDLIDMGLRVEVSLTMMEYVKENLAVALPQGHEYTSYVTAGKMAGTELSGQAGELVLHPADKAASDTTEDIVIHKAVCTGSFELPLGTANDRVLNVTFVALLDTSKPEESRLLQVGIPAR